jgi:DNA-binding NarL/FixJ family response regulator
MAALALISDLVLQSQLAAAAQRAGVEATIAASEDGLVEAAQRLRPALVIVDLAHPGLDAAALLNRLRPHLAPDAQTVAFGPHVHKERLAAAAEAGYKLVISRGQFHAQMEEILKQYAR